MSISGEPFISPVLHQAADPFRLMVESVKDYAIYLLDPEGRIASWNIGAQRIKGYTAEEVLGRPYASMFSPQAIADGKPAHDLAAALALGEYEEEGPRLRKDGSMFWAVCSVTALHQNDQHVGFAVVVRDITERKRTDALLREAEERFRAFMEHVPAQVWIDDEDGISHYVNPALARGLGLPLADIIGRPIVDLVPPGIDATDYIQTNRAVIESGQPVQATVSAPRPDGSIGRFLMHKFPLGKAANGRRLVGGSAIDITEREQAIEALRRSEARFRSLIEATSNMVWITDASGERPTTTPSWAEFTGLPAEDVAGSNWIKPVHPDDRERIVHGWQQAIATSSPYNVAYRVQRGDKQWRYLHVRGVPIFRDDGSVQEWVGVCIDETEQRKLEDALQQSQKMEAIGRLAGGVAHDFNNLLTIILGYGDMLMAQLPTADANRTLVSAILQAAERAARLTRQLLTLSRNQVIEPVVLDLNEVVIQAEKMLSRVIGEDIALTCVLDRQLGRVRADTGQIDQIIMNLCVNARDAMPQGGRLTIQTQDVVLEHPHSAYPDLQPGRFAQLSITDSGHGMTDEVKSRIFEPFFTTKGVGKGTGLGLAIVFGIVKQNNCHISVYSEVGIGTSVKILFPTIAEEITPLASLKAAPALRGTETILLVEDEDGVRNIARLSLEAQGYTVIEASGGHQAMRLMQLHTEPVHLLLTDVVMPGMGGRQLAELLRLFRPELKVLFMSGYTDDAIIRHGIIQQTDIFLQKPFTPVSLAKKVRWVLDQP